MENTKRWSKAFSWMGYISIIIFILVNIRIIIGFEYPTQQQYHLMIIDTRTITLIIGVFSLLIGSAIKSIYREALQMFR